MASDLANILPNISHGEVPTFDVKFPLSPNLNFYVIGAELFQSADEHDRLVLQFKGNPFSDDTVIAPEDPVIFTYWNDLVSMTWNGYVYQIPQTNGPRANNTEIICLGATYVMKNSAQKIYKNVTADAVVSKVAAKYGFKAVTQRHPRVRQSVAQAGQSDWQLLRSLAAQTGYALIPDNTSIIFMSKNKLFLDKKANAPYFDYLNTTTTGIVRKTERIYGSIISFTPKLSEQAPDRGARVDRVISGRHLVNGTLITNKYPYKGTLTNSIGTVIPGETYFE